MMNPRFGDIHKVDHVVIAVACQKRRDAFEFVRVPKAKETLVKPPQFVGLGADHRDMSKAQGRHAAFLEPRRGRFNIRVKLKDMAWDDLDLDQRGDAGLTVRLRLGTQAEIAKTLRKVRGLDIRLELEAKAHQRLLVGFLENDVVMLVADREISLLVVTLCGLRQAQNV